MKQTIRWVLIVLLLIVFSVSVGMVLRDLLSYKKGADTNRELAAMLHEAESKVQPVPETSPDAETAPESDETASRPQFSTLLERNPDMAGWLRMEGIDVDLPVMYTPEEQNYYIDKNFDRESQRGGTLFLAVPWSPQSNQAIIYGHNMKNGSMFGRLLRYQDAAFGKKNARISFDTLSESGEYELVGAFYGRVYSVDEVGGFRYYDYPDLSDEADFDYFVSQVKKAALYDTGVTPEYGDRLLTLSTCEYSDDNGRFIVVFRLRQEP